MKSRLLLIICACALTGCSDSSREEDQSQRLQPSKALETLEQIPLGDLAGAGAIRVTLAASIVNPYRGNPEAEQAGGELFKSMNCVGCHGYEAEGGMGPMLTDDFWLYGGLPPEVFNSIYEGRPKGMPAFGLMLPPGEIWKIVTYLEALHGLETLAEARGLPEGGLRRGVKSLKGRRFETRN